MNLLVVEGLSRNSDKRSRQSLVSILVYIEMASKEKMLHFLDTFNCLRTFVNAKESLKYEGMDFTMGWSIWLTHIPKAWGVEVQSEQTGLVFKGVL